MAKKTKKKSSFRGKVVNNAKTQKAAGSNFGYINLPSGMKFFTPFPGNKEKFDIIPYYITDATHGDIAPKSGLEVGDLWYRKPFKVHKKVGADNDTVVCLQTWKKKCPICELRKKRAKEGATKEELEQYNSSKRSLYLVIPRGIKKFEEEVHIFDFSDWNFQKLLNEELLEKPKYEIFPDLEEGYTLSVRWSEEVFNKNKFATAARIDFDDREDAIEESILDECPDLDVLLKEMSYDELEAKFLEIENGELDESEQEETEDEEETEEAEEKSSKKKGKKEKSKKNSKQEEEEEEEEAEEEADIDLDWMDLMDMEEAELAEVCESNELEYDEDEDEDFNREMIAKALSIEIPKKKDKKKEAKKESSKKESKDKKCPEGFKFGVDTDAKKTKGACDTCDLWDECDEAKENKEG